MNKTILIVEDSKTYLALASAALKAAGFRVLQSETIWISRLVSQHRPDLVLMDVSVGGCKGTAAVAALRKCQFGQDLKILLHSAEPDSLLSTLSKDCGADGFIGKSGDCDTLVERVKKALASR
ncbi:MAG TPA: response regulator [Pseudomonadales bacterium]